MVKNLKEFKATHVDGAAGTAFVPGAGENTPSAKPRRADNMKNKEGHMKQGSSDVKSGLEAEKSTPGQTSKRRADKDGNKEGVMKQGSSDVKAGLEGSSGPGSLGQAPGGETKMYQGSSMVKSGLEPAHYAYEDKLHAIMQSMSELSEEEVDDIYNSLVEEEVGSEEEIEMEEEVVLPDPFEKVKLTLEDVGDIDFGKIFEGDDLTEDFKTKATTIFEGAVVAAANMRLEEALDKLEDVYAHEVGLIKTELEENLDNYLDHVVENWEVENELDVKTGVKDEIMEDFIAGLKTLFAEHYVEIPEEKVDVVETLEARINELEERLNNSVNENIEMNEAIEDFMKEGIIVELAEDMTELNSDKLRTFAENIEYESDENFREKLSVMKKNYFSNEKGEAQNLGEEFDTLKVKDDDDDVDPMQALARRVSSLNKSTRPFSLKNQ